MVDGGETGHFSVDMVGIVPIPGTLLLMVIGLVALFWAYWRMNRGS